MTNTLSCNFDSLNLFYKEIGKFDRLSREEEYSLAVRLYEHNDQEAAHKLITHNLYIVGAIAREYRKFNVPEMDLIQEGVIGLMKAIRKFDPYKGFRLMTYAAWNVHYHIKQFILTTWSVVNMGTRNLHKRVFQSLGFDSKELDISNEEVRLIANTFKNGDDSIDETNHDTFVDDCDVERIVIDDNLRNSVVDAIDKLNDRWKDIIVNRYLVDEPVHLKVLADKYGVSIERVRQLEVKAIKKLKEILND